MRSYVISLVVSLCLLAFATSAGAAVQFNDPMNDQQWYLDAVHLPDAWSQVARTPQRSAITVAVIDSGFDMKHPDLRRNLTGGFNVVSRNTKVEPVHPHGTATAGVLGAVSGNNKGISGAAWTSQILPIQITNRSDGGAYNYDIAAGVRYAVDQGARVINISYDGVSDPRLNKISRYAARRGAVIVMAAGNDGRLNHWWENYPNIIAVGSIDDDGERSQFSNRGDFVDLLAPGRGMITLKPDKKYSTWTGTSFSSPLVASVAAMALSVNPDLTPKQLRGVLFDSATDIYVQGKDRRSGHGILNAEAAILLALETEGKWGSKRWHEDITVEWDTAPLDQYPGLTALSFDGKRPADANLLQVLGNLESFDSADDSRTAIVPEPATVLLMIGGTLLIISRR